MNNESFDELLDHIAGSGSGKKASAGSTGAGEIENAELRRLWDDLGDMPKEDLSNPKIVSNFRTRLSDYENGWNDALKKEAASRKGKGLLTSFRSPISYGIAAGIAVALFLSGILSNRYVNQYHDFQNDLAQTREALAFALLSQPSAPKRVVGLNEISKIPTPSEELVDAILWTLDNDANLNVRLAAVEAIETMPKADLVRLLVERLQKQNSPLVQMEIIRAALQRGSPSDRAEINQAIETLDLPPSAKAIIQNTESKI